MDDRTSNVAQPGRRAGPVTPEGAPPGMTAEEWRDWYAAQHKTAEGLPVTDDGWILSPSGVHPEDFMDWWNNPHDDP
jgi:hypothetical protein